MPDDNRFESIGSQLDDDDDVDEDETEVESTHSETDVELQDETADDATSAVDEQEAGEQDPMSTPAFEYDDVKKNSVYPRADTWESFDATITLAKGKLRTEHDLSSVENRELHDAALSLIAEDPDQLVEEVLELRGVETDN